MANNREETERRFAVIGEVRRLLTTVEFELMEDKPDERKVSAFAGLAVRHMVKEFYGEEES